MPEIANFLLSKSRTQAKLRNKPMSSRVEASRVQSIPWQLLRV